MATHITIQHTGYIQGAAATVRSTYCAGNFTNYLQQAEESHTGQVTSLAEIFTLDAYIN